MLNRFEVRRIAASTNPTQMVKLLTIRDRTDEPLVDHAVDINHRLMTTALADVTVSSGGPSAGPNPTAILVEDDPPSDPFAQSHPAAELRGLQDRVLETALAHMPGHGQNLGRMPTEIVRMNSRCHPHVARDGAGAPDRHRPARRSRSADRRVSRRATRNRRRLSARPEGFRPGEAGPFHGPGS